ncbi:unnamed protein product [Symbiodinium necroappetens]|uniref:Uncharacterized protein n=1 Tax=Symbiodinium necroappetens TaxID=1628268 RepID=A0A812NS99_9DINO|nr:unnamed protein product [Symbiodinium necroappetens]
MCHEEGLVKMQDTFWYACTKAIYQDEPATGDVLIRDVVENIRHGGSCGGVLQGAGARSAVEVTFALASSEVPLGASAGHLLGLQRIVVSTASAGDSNAACFFLDWAGQVKFGRLSLDPGIMADAESDAGKWPASWPPKFALARKWDEHIVLREQMRRTGKLLIWDTPASTGVANKTSLRLNRFAIAAVLEVWVGTSDSPKSPPIGWLRAEAR